MREERTPPPDHTGRSHMACRDRRLSSRVDREAKARAPDRYASAARTPSCCKPFCELQGAPIWQADLYETARNLIVQTSELMEPQQGRVHIGRRHVGQSPKNAIDDPNGGALDLRD